MDYRRDFKSILRDGTPQVEPGAAPFLMVPWCRQPVITVPIDEGDGLTIVR
jgi:hypothetical protein